MNNIIEKFNDYIKEKTKDLSMKQKTVIITGSVVALLVVIPVIARGSSYKEFNTLEEIQQLKNMDCVELLKKNEGNKRKYCGLFYEKTTKVYSKYNTSTFYHFLIHKSDLYNNDSEPQNCGIGDRTKLYNDDSLAQEYCGTNIRPSDKAATLSRTAHNMRIIIKGTLTPVKETGACCIFDEVQFVDFNDTEQVE